MYMCLVSNWLRCSQASVRVWDVSWPGCWSKLLTGSTRLWKGKKHFHEERHNYQHVRWRNISLYRYLSIFCIFLLYSRCVPMHKQPRSVCLLCLTLLSICVPPSCQVQPPLQCIDLVGAEHWLRTAKHIQMFGKHQQVLGKRQLINEWFFGVFMSMCSFSVKNRLKSFSTMQQQKMGYLEINISPPLPLTSR